MQRSSELPSVRLGDFPRGGDLTTQPLPRAECGVRSCGLSVVSQCTLWRPAGYSRQGATKLNCSMSSFEATTSRPSEIMVLA